MMNEQWRAVCRLDDIEPETGVGGRLLDHRQAALFRTRDDRLFALDNHDPFSHANVLARGLLGSLQGRRVVASPIYKQHFCLDTGQCLEDEDVKVKTYQVLLDGNAVRLEVSKSKATAEAA